MTSDRVNALPSRADVVVVGGGHAGAEAACAAARRGAATLLVTLHADAVGRMSCNPSIGGIAKGQLVREVDALGGIMGRCADASAIHYRLLNRSKGPAVQSPRSQNDRAAYEEAVRAECRDAGVRIVEDEVVDLVLDSGAVAGVVLATFGTIAARAVVLTTGTFLGGVLHVGLETTEGGRVGERAAHRLAGRLAEVGLATGRLKTGTPPRLLAASIDWDRTEPQPSDEPPVTFSFFDVPGLKARVACAITRTTEATHAVIRGGLDRSPLFSGKIKGRGPRYCPSIEDKIFRFPDQPGHQIFLEPDGLESPWVYPGGISTSLPKDVQLAMVRSIPALERAEIVQWGYAVEYVHVDPTECDITLEVRKIPGLFLAGQINGTTGYEEAAAQGLIAGVNASARVFGKDPLILGRDEAYLGVLIDDLVRRGVDEPYRMFTSLAEHRLLLRHHDADVRLLHRAEAVGLHSAERLSAIRARADRRRRVRDALTTTKHAGKSWFDRLRSVDVTLDEALAHVDPHLTTELDASDRENLLIEGRYAGYLERERESRRRDVASMGRSIPKGFDFADVAQLRYEAREKWSRARPRTVEQAARLPGISPADVTLLLIHLARTDGPERTSAESPE